MDIVVHLCYRELQPSGGRRCLSVCACLCLVRGKGFAWSLQSFFKMESRGHEVERWYEVIEVMHSLSSSLMCPIPQR